MKKKNFAKTGVQSSPPKSFRKITFQKKKKKKKKLQRII